MTEKCEITCPFCHAEWDEMNLQLYDLEALNGCDSCGYGSGVTATIEIKCHNCERMMYRKEGYSVNGWE